MRSILAVGWLVLTVSVAPAATPAPTDKPAAASPTWRVIPAKSEMGFTAYQAGAAFEGKFQKFTADIRFDPKNLAASRFDVGVEIASVNTGDSDRDGTLVGVDFLWAQRSPQARYVAEQFTARQGGTFVANGKLTMRGVTKDVPVTFTFQQSGKTAVLKGEATLKRLDFRVGVGEWESTEWINNDVKPHFVLNLIRD